MSFSTEIIDNIFHYLPPVSFSDLMVYSKVNKAWYFSARRAFYKTLTITGYTRLDLLFPCLDYNNTKLLVVNLRFIKQKPSEPRLIPLERTASGLVHRCTNIRKIEIDGLNPYPILRNIKSASLPKIEEIYVNWENCNSSTGVREMFIAANHSHTDTIKRVTMPYFALSEVIEIDEIKYTVEEFFKEFFDLTSLVKTPPP